MKEGMKEDRTSAEEVYL